MHTLSETGDVDSLEKLIDASDSEETDQKTTDWIEHFTIPEGRKRDI